MKTNRESQGIILVFLLSFLCGICYTNFIAGSYVTVTGVFYDGFLNQYLQMELISTEYLLYLLKNRTLPLVILGVAATTRYRKFAATLILAWTGFAGGILAVTSVLRMGGVGMLFFVAAIFPHFIFYAISYFIIIWYCYKYPDVGWNSWKTSFVFVMHFTGIVVEAYLNPQLLHLVIELLL